MNTNGHKLKKFQDSRLFVVDPNCVILAAHGQRRCTEGRACHPNHRDAKGYES